MSQGWVKNWRKLKEWEWYTTPHMAHLFQHLIREANHEPKKWKGVVIERGQVVTGRKILSLETGISEQTIRTCLERLKSTSELTIQATNKFSIITIANYDIYQYLKDENNQQINQQTPNNQPTTNQQLTTTKNDKNVENDKKKERESARAKQKFLEFVFLTEEEHQKLTERLGDEDTRAYIERLNNYLGSKGKKYKSHYHTILNWRQKDHDGERIPATQRAVASPAGQQRPRINDQDWGELTDPAA